MQRLEKLNLIRFYCIFLNWISKFNSNDSTLFTYLFIY